MIFTPITQKSTFWINDIKFKKTLKGALVTVFRTLKWLKNSFISNKEKQNS